jgi:uncharacterized protein (UPF0264 family)
LKLVPAAYADSERSEAPSLHEVASFVIEYGFPILLIDTYIKDGRGLFDWVSAKDLEHLTDKLRKHKIDLALAGSLTINDLPRIEAIGPAWLAVRGAVCRAGARTNAIDAQRVRELKLAMTPG